MFFCRASGLSWKLPITDNLQDKKFMALLIHTCMDGRNDLINHKVLLFGEASKFFNNDQLCLDGNPHGCYQLVKKDPSNAGVQDVNDFSLLHNPIATGLSVTFKKWKFQKKKECLCFRLGIVLIFHVYMSVFVWGWCCFFFMNQKIRNRTRNSLLNVINCMLFLVPFLFNYFQPHS